jgi:Phage integrase, N-terminal SAM-like domain
MVSDFRPESRQNSGDKVFEGIPVGKQELTLFAAFLDHHDFSENSRRAFTQDIRKFAVWFSSANRECFVVGRVTTRDVTDFREHLRREQCQAVATVNRCLVTLRRWFGWLVELGHVASNPAKKVKELRRIQLAPKGLARAEVRKLLREVDCGRTFEPVRSSRCSCTPAAVLVTSWRSNSQTCSLATEAAPLSSGSARATSNAQCHCPYLLAVLWRLTWRSDRRRVVVVYSSASVGH